MSGLMDVIKIDDFTLQYEPISHPFHESLRKFQDKFYRSSVDSARKIKIHPKTLSNLNKVKYFIGIYYVKC